MLDAEDDASRGERMASAALDRFESLAETGEIPTLERNPSARGSGDLAWRDVIGMGRDGTLSGWDVTGRRRAGRDGTLSAWVSVRRSVGS